MKKRLFSLLTSLIMVVSLVGVMPGMTAGAETSGDYKYEFLDDGTVEITDYNSSVTEFDCKKVAVIGSTLNAITGELKSVQIPKGITPISKYSFHSETDVGAVIALVVGGVILGGVVVFGIAFAIRKRKK